MLKIYCFASILLLILIFAQSSPVFAQAPTGGGSGAAPDLNGTIDTVVGFIRDVTLSALRFGLFLSGMIFLVSVVWGSARGSIATAIGNHTQASEGLITAIMAVATLVLVLVAVPLTNVVTRTLIDKFLTPDSLRMDVGKLVNTAASGSGAAAAVDPKNILQIPALQQTIEDLSFAAIRFALALGVIATVVATFLGAFDTQLGSLFGGGMLASRGIMRIIAAIGQLIILVISLPLAKMLLAVLVPKLVNLDIQLPFQPMSMRKIFLGTLLLFGVSLIAFASPVHAESAQGPQAFFQQPAATPVPPASTPPPPTASPTPRPNPLQQILHVIQFDATGSLLSAWTTVVQKAQEKALQEMRPSLEAAASQAARDFLRFSGKGLEGIDTGGSQGSFLGAVQDLWSKVFSVAVLFFPLAVLMNLAAVLVSGVSAPVARAEMLEALVRSLLALGISAGSYLITGAMIKIAWGAAEVVLAQPVSGTGSELIDLFDRLAVGALDSDMLTSLLSIFITLTIIFLVLMAISALILSYYALLALTVGMVTLSPLVIVIGNLPEFHWVYATWLRAFVGVLLVPLGDAILFKMLAVFGLQGKSLVDVLVGLGFLGILVSLNFYAGKLVFAPVIEAGKMAAGSLLGLIRLGASAVGLVVGMAAVGGAAGAAGSAGATAGGSLAPGVPPNPAGPIGGGQGNPSPIPVSGSPESRSSPFQQRVAAWRSRPSQERQAAFAGLEQETLRTHAQGQIAQTIAGRDPLLRAAAQAWTTSRQAGLAYERSAIRSADQLEAAQVRTLRASGSRAVPDPTSQPPPALNPTGAATGPVLPPGASGIYPALFGNPAYTERTLAASGWNARYQERLRADVRGLYGGAHSAAAAAHLPDGNVIYDPLLTHPVQAGGERITPVRFQAAAVRLSAPWLSQASVTGNLAGARVMERGTAEEILGTVSQRLEAEPIGRLSRSILEVSRNEAGSRSTPDFWERVRG